ncbi:DUF4249 domain-containing protein [Spirosoma utsteinense]|uniref:DUF4249 domain-containing protein n=1 Tax=Spirosoma utsteinense TaxID=2585773 RepID=A0ABR6WF29_9BACT|nr:DUF4249 domain-containing protein [Spirosoma utsteinense]MBC3785686.1 hypothetical protein [Spirosoma utsteinense]MBC3795137.1 hypothetical protein [Spirosoma utsteinense]
MRAFIWWVVICLPVSWAALGCVDPIEQTLAGTVDVIVVDGTLTNRAEPQQIILNRSRADPLSGRFGVLPITKATVEILVDSAQVISCLESVDGTYRLPSDFKGLVDHAYQLRFTLSDGTRYASSTQIMPEVPPIERLSVAFNATSLPPGLYSFGFRAGYDVLLSTRDPATQRNYYRWDWKLIEKQHWCKSCYKSVYLDSLQEQYLQNGQLVTTRKAVEACVESTVNPLDRDYYNDYHCRTPCWEIITNSTINLFDDQLSNGGALANRNVGQVPLLTRQPALLEVRQLSLTREAYQFYQRLQQQTQNTGGIADTPPSAPVGNLHNMANREEVVVGFFTASAVSTARQWLDKTDATRLPYGSYDEAGQIVQFDDELFYSLIRRVPVLGQSATPFAPGAPPRLITAPCLAGTNRTPIKPEGWQN